MTETISVLGLDDGKRLKIAKIGALVNNGVPASIANCLGGLLAFYVATVAADSWLPWFTLSLHLLAAVTELVGSSWIKRDLSKNRFSDADIRRYEWQLIFQRGFFAAGWGVYGFVFFDPANQQVSLLIMACLLTFAVSASAYGGYNMVTLVNGRLLTLGPTIIATLMTLPPQWPIFILVCISGIVLGLLIGLNVDRTFTTAFENRLRAERAAQALDEAKEELEGALSFGHRMIDVICHDLQQPLKALELYAHQLLNREDGSDSIDRVRLREGIQRSTSNVSYLVRQLSDAQRARGDQFDPQFSDISIDELFSRLAVDFEPVARAEGVDLRFIECSLIVRADLILIERILRNLIDNAIKYGCSKQSVQSRVIVGCRRSVNDVTVSVIDGGRGIETAKLAQIFDPYNQLKRGSSGLGLGLFIAQRLAIAMGATLTVKSVVGRGTAFSLKLRKASKP